MTPTKLQDHLLLGRTITLGDKRYRLLESLGSGATAVVLKGEALSEQQGQVKQYAIKFTTDEDNAIKERDNLRKLNQEQDKEKRSYFPRLHYPISSSDSLRQSYYLGNEEWLENYVLVQELAQGEGVHDLLLEFPPSLALPEPLALEIGRQYVDMLVLSHKAGITSWDRKLGDLHWETANDVRLQKMLQLWREGSLGNLKVIDWNVTRDAAKKGNIAKDILRFGLLWHRMLLGTEPRFQRGETWR